MQNILKIIKYIYFFVLDFINRNTTGVPFMLWSAMGLFISIFLFIFKDRYFVNFDRLIYVLLLSMVWFVGSDVIKKRKLFKQNFHFIADSMFYILTFSSIYYFTGGDKGNLFFIFFLIAISAPLFGTFRQAVALLFFSALAIFAINWELHFKYDSVNYYEVGIIILLFFIQITVAGIIKFFQKKYEMEIENVSRYQKNLVEMNKKLQEEFDQKSELERRVSERNKQLEKIKSNLKSTVEKQTKNLREKLEEIKRVNDLVIGREIKMMELKEEIEKLKEQTK